MSRNNFQPGFINVYEEPDQHSELWRYMDFAKFVSMLSTQCLWASSAASFDDPFEGAIGLYDDRPAYIRTQIENIKQDWQSIGNEITYENYLDIKKQIHEVEADKIKRRNTTYINCWYESQYESIAMWQLYSKDNQNAVAIRSSFRRIKESVLDRESTQIGRVNYIDYSIPTEVLECFPYWFKSFHFEHENEVRVVPVVKIENFKDAPNGVLLKVDVNILVACVYVSPWAQPWLLALVKDVCLKYGLVANVRESAIAKRPYY